jgi:hypothetical protein
VAQHYRETNALAPDSPICILLGIDEASQLLCGPSNERKYLKQCFDAIGGAMMNYNANIFLLLC